MTQSTTTAAVADFAHRRLADLVAQANRYHANALRDRSAGDKPWARMIDVLLGDLNGIGQLGVFVGSIGDVTLSRSIEVDIKLTSDRLIQLAHEARMASIPGWDPSTRAFRPVTHRAAA